MPQKLFDYDVAFSRNLGWLTAWEQNVLQNKKVAIAGMGGVGGVEALTLARLGVGRFHLADMDTYEVANFNRQAGAFMSTVGRAKVEVIAKQVADINPAAAITRFPEGVTPATVDAFLDGVDVYIDGLDFFTLDARRLVLQRCRKLGIPAVSAAPVGWGVAWLIFMPDAMTFDSYFGFRDGQSQDEQQARFVAGLTPQALQRKELVAPGFVNPLAGRICSVGASPMLCAGVVGAEAVKLLVGRGPVKAAPHYQQFDAFRGRYAKGKLLFGNGGPLQRIKIGLLKRRLHAMAKQASLQPDEEHGGDDLAAIVDLARWAPSGDNTQPWRFQQTGASSLEVIVDAVSSHQDPYAFAPGLSLMHAGVLLEALRLAASQYGRACSWKLVEKTSKIYRFNVSFPRSKQVEADPLVAFVRHRSVYRRPLQREPLSASVKQELALALGSKFSVQWFESPRAKWRMTRMNTLATDIRLRMPEAFAKHGKVVRSEDKAAWGMPAASIGLDAFASRIMLWSLKSWRRTRVLNSLPGFLAVPKMQMDILPGLFCGAHFAITTAKPFWQAKQDKDFIEAGACLQRFWLTCTAHGLAMQPSLAPVAFANYAYNQVQFTTSGRLRRRAGRLARVLAATVHHDVQQVVMLGRIGRPKTLKPWGRSLRLPLAEVYRQSGKTKPHGLARKKEQQPRQRNKED